MKSKMKGSATPWIIFSLIVVIISLTFVLYFEGKSRKIVCSEKGVVTSIDKVHHRTVYFTVNNEHEMKTNQPKNFTVGKEFCLKYKIYSALDDSIPKEDPELAKLSLNLK
tara:strand:+ start:50018 stop:50347 length:330 start_codon:yes stop_codon:yes gene_type:complete